MHCSSASVPCSSRGISHTSGLLAHKPACRSAVVARANGTRSPQGQEANSVLDAFFLGKAVAETVNERVGAALGEVLSEVTKANAERGNAWRSFQQEVQQRADREKELRTGISLGAFPTTAQPPQVGQPRSEVSQSSTSGWRSQSQALRDSGGSLPISSSDQADADLQELADDLRAEIASARAMLLQLGRKTAVEQE